MKPARWKLFLRSFLRLKPICDVIFNVRYFYFMHLRRAFRVHGDERAVLAHDYSRNSLFNNRPSDRILKLIRPLSVLDKLGRDAKVIAIGCRYESDLLYLVGYGFDPSKVRGLDMYSYSPWVDPGNMHSMEYPDNTWDAALMGWVLSYSDDPSLAAREVVRVLRNGGVVAIGVTYYARDELRAMEDKGQKWGIQNRIQTTDGILAVFGDFVDQVHFRQDAHDLSQSASCLVIFSIKK